MEKCIPVKLTLMESGTLCHVLMDKFLACGGLEAQPPWVIQLYEKIAVANDKLMEKRNG